MIGIDSPWSIIAYNRMQLILFSGAVRLGTSDEWFDSRLNCLLKVHEKDTVQDTIVFCLWCFMKMDFGAGRFRFVKVDGKMVKIDLDHVDRVFEKFEKDERILRCQKQKKKKV